MAAARRPRERAAGAPARRPRPHRELLARPHRPVLRAALARTTTASSWPSAATPPCRRSTRGSRSPPPCTAAPTSATPGTPSRRSPPPRRSARAPTAAAPSPPGHPADLALLDADPLAPGTSLDQATALRSMHVAATWVAGDARPRGAGRSRIVRTRNGRSQRRSARCIAVGTIRRLSTKPQRDGQLEDGVRGPRGGRRRPRGAGPCGSARSGGARTARRRRRRGGRGAAARSAASRSASRRWSRASSSSGASTRARRSA